MSATTMITNIASLQNAPGGIDKVAIKAAKQVDKERLAAEKAEKKAAKEAKKAAAEKLKAEKKAAKEAKQVAKDAKKTTKEPKLRANTAYVFFLNAETARMKQQSLNPHERLKAIAASWKSLDDKGQAPYKKQYEDEKQRIADLSEVEALAEYNASAAGQRASKKAATAAKKAAKEAVIAVAPVVIEESAAVVASAAVIEEPPAAVAVDFGSLVEEDTNEKITTPQNSPQGLPADGVGAAIISAATASSNAIAATTNAIAVGNLTHIDEDIFNAEPDSSSVLGKCVIEAAHAAKAFAAASVAVQTEMSEMKKQFAELEANSKRELGRKGEVIRKLTEENQALKEAAKSMTAPKPATLVTDQLNEALHATNQSPVKELEVKEPEVKQSPTKQSPAKDPETKESPVEELTAEVTPKTFEDGGAEESSPMFTMNEDESEKTRDIEGYTYTETSGVIYNTEGDSVGYTGEDNDEIEWVSGWNPKTHQMEE